MYYWKLFKRKIIIVYSAGVIKLWQHLQFTFVQTPSRSGWLLTDKLLLSLAGDVVPESVRSEVKSVVRWQWKILQSIMSLTSPRHSAGCCSRCLVVPTWSWWRWGDCRPSRRKFPRPGSPSAQSRPLWPPWESRGRPAPAGRSRRPAQPPASHSRGWRRDSWPGPAPASCTYCQPLCTRPHTFHLHLHLHLLHHLRYIGRGLLPDRRRQDTVHWESRTVHDTDCRLEIFWN